jgi:hypothetical protein
VYLRMSFDKITMTYYTGLCKVMQHLLDGLDSVLRAEATPPGPERVDSEGQPLQSGWFVGVTDHTYRNIWKVNRSFTMAHSLRLDGCRIIISAVIMQNESPVEMKREAISEIAMVTAAFTRDKFLSNYDQVGLAISTKTQSNLLFNLVSMNTPHQESLPERKLERLSLFLLLENMRRTPAQITIAHNGQAYVKLTAGLDCVFQPTDDCFFRPGDD